tara:strand:- start:523 stop:1074 length:552 start_codon:yes stop_codon:yes gene_type:complete
MIDETYCGSICDMLKVNTTLKSLDLGNNYLNDNSCQFICDILKTNTTLTHINLENNEFTYRGCTIICDMLKTNTTLTSIDLSNNSFHEEGCKFICDMLKVNTTLTSIDLSNNDSGVYKIIEDSVKKSCERNVEIKDRVRDAVILLITARRYCSSDLNIFPKEIVLMIARMVWAGKSDLKWMPK